MSLFERFLGAAWGNQTSLPQMVQLWRPVTPSHPLLAPLMALAAAITAGLLAGVALASLAVLLAALWALQYLLIDVLGLSIDLARP